MDTCLLGSRALGTHLGVVAEASRDPDGAEWGLVAKLEFSEQNEASGRVRKVLGGLPAYP